ncbi:hypothetical protein ALQ25_200276 [Pseudomonas coronafaciens pv. atropurpurea]|nr:hypothetical protein ALQ25_200276 [Pseudomonas coronafaciens pv. atropurpurea]
MPTGYSKKRKILLRCFLTLLRLSQFRHENMAPPEHHNHRYFITQEERLGRDLAANRNTGPTHSTCVRKRQR